MTDSTNQASIRRATADDAAALAALGRATFTEAFAQLYAPEDLQTYLCKAHSVDTWNRTLADPQRAAWVATLADSTPIGFITVGACRLPIEHPEPAAGEIHQVYVLSGYQNLRLGTRLMDLGLKWLEAHGRTPVYLGVWSENLGAQRFYGRYGFGKVGEYDFPVGRTLDREFILKR